MTKTTKATKKCPAAGRDDLLCIKGRILLRLDGKTLFWGTCTNCVKATGGTR